ncbi:MAG: 3,4-dihydroxy-2-butanone-4-phosphate synthase [Micavibrio sp. TMED2]|nr:MAG: 3,4-dihydroxy-2-butanone-4-phosphate synthase [Micavibrio sp. TMED2]|tara:strand:+ start:8613 stop:9737 length:1125 start_codon:yes stop_codon:yes gene_type:complete
MTEVSTAPTAEMATAEELIEEARQGRMVVLVDDEDRENEGDLVIPADCADADAINFMAKYGRGLICLALTSERADDLGLKLMTSHNSSRHETAFTISIEAREGVTTGISAADRAHTIAVAINQSSTASDLATPGHVFPLRARDGGVLVRAGHTEAAVDLARLGDRKAAGVICEIMNDDGTMARLPDLIPFARQHGLKIGTIADLIAYRRRTEKLVRRELEAPFTSSFGGEFRMIVYANESEYAEHVAFVMGDVDSDEPSLVRMHALDIFDDLLGFNNSQRGAELQQSMQAIAEAGRGAVVILREPQANTLSQRFRTRIDEKSRSSHELRDYGVGAQILRDLGIRRMILLSNSRRTVIGLDGYGLEITGYQPIPI